MHTLALTWLPSPTAGHHTEAVTYGGLTLHKPERWQSMWGEGLAGLMWWAFPASEVR